MIKSTLWEEEDLTHLKVEISTLNNETPPAIRAVVSSTVKLLAAQLSEGLWRELAQNPRTQALFDDKADAERFRQSSTQWLLDLFPKVPADPAVFLARQLELGATQARIQLPASLSILGMCSIKREVYQHLRKGKLSGEEFALAILYVSGVISVAAAAAIAGHIGGLERSMRAEEALRQVSIDHDLRAERERQKAALAEWAQAIFFGLGVKNELEDLRLLSQSEFGIWFIHRASLLFGRSSEYASIVELVDQADDIVRQLRRGPDEATLQADQREIRQIVSEINALLSSQFSRSLDQGSARDPLSRLLNRRFLKAAIDREIALHRRSGRPFSVIMLEIAHFSPLRTRLGEAGADAIVQQTAGMLLNAVRSSDMVFSMGRETFLILRVETDAKEAANFSRSIVESYAASHFTINDQTVLDNALNVGVMEYDNHTDPRRLVDEVARAMRGEKTGG